MQRKSPLLLELPFCKLPHPAAQFYASLKIIDGTDCSSLLQFISIALKVKLCAGMTDRVLLQSLFPYSRGLLANKINKGVQQNYSFDNFHAKVIRELIPS